MTEPMPEFTFPEPLAVLDHAFPDAGGVYQRIYNFPCSTYAASQWHNCGGDRVDIIDD